MVVDNASAIDPGPLVREVSTDIHYLRNSMNSEITVGFIGFGEAGSNIANGLKSAGLTRIVAFDIDPEKVRRNEQETGVPLVSSNRELAAVLKRTRSHRD